MKDFGPHLYGSLIILNTYIPVNTFITMKWAVGLLTKNKIFSGKFRNEYFLADPELFTLQHYPENSYDQLVNFRISKIYFASSPSFLLGAVENEVLSCASHSSMITAKYKSGHSFSFTSR